MEVHVLNGDALAEKFPISGDKIICREALIDGPVQNNGLKLFWDERARFLSAENQEAYFDLVVSEYEKLEETSATAINLWFEHDLFCQVNLWFTIAFLQQFNTKASLFIVSPSNLEDPSWSGFGNMSAKDLRDCYNARVPLTNIEKQLAIALWKAYQSDNKTEFEILSNQPSDAFPLLRQVCKAHLDRFPSEGLGRPQKALQSIIETGETRFDKIFTHFQAAQGVYGFGDLQVKRLLSELPGP